MYNPLKLVVFSRKQGIVESGEEAIDVAINLCLYVMKTQVFIDGNKRAAVIFANHYMISKGAGLLVIPESAGIFPCAVEVLRIDATIGDHILHTENSPFRGSRGVNVYDAGLGEKCAP